MFRSGAEEAKRNKEEYGGIKRNKEEYRGIKRNKEEYRGVEEAESFLHRVFGVSAPLYTEL